MKRGLSAAEIAACPDAARPVLARYGAGEISAEVAVMQLLLASGGMAPPHDRAREVSPGAVVFVDEAGRISGATP